MPSIKANLSALTFWESPTHYTAADFIEDNDFPVDLVKDVVRAPQDVQLDPYSEKVGHTVLRFRRGDISVVVGFRDPMEPVVLFIHLIDPDEHAKPTQGSQGGRGKAPRTSTGKKPHSVNQLLGWAQSQGLRVQHNGRGHYNVFYGDILLGGVVATATNISVMSNYDFLRKRLGAEKLKAEWNNREEGSK